MLCVFVVLLPINFPRAFEGKKNSEKKNYMPDNCYKTNKFVNLLKMYFVHLQNNKCIISLHFNGGEK